MIRLALLIWLALAPLAAAQIVAEAENEPRIRALAATLRCPVCQSESILESQAATAREMMMLLREQVAEGRTDAEITAFFRARYGDFVTLAPPPNAVGGMIWALPVLLLLGGALVWVRALRRPGRPAPDAPPPDAPPLDEARLKEMGP